MSKRETVIRPHRRASDRMITDLTLLAEGSSVTDVVSLADSDWPTTITLCPVCSKPGIASSRITENGTWVHSLLLHDSLVEVISYCRISA